MNGVEPNARGSWRRVLNRKTLAEAIEADERLDQLLEDPLFRQIRTLLVEAHDEIVRHLVGDPRVLDQAQYARRTGEAAGVRGLEDLVNDIRADADKARKQLAAEQPSAARPLEVVA